MAIKHFISERGQVKQRGPLRGPEFSNTNTLYSKQLCPQIKLRH